MLITYIYINGSTERKWDLIEDVCVLLNGSLLPLLLGVVVFGGVCECAY